MSWAEDFYKKIQRKSGNICNSHLFQGTETHFLFTCGKEFNFACLSFALGLMIDR